MKKSTSKLMVSICCITYNHEKYIGDAIEGFLMQNTDFDFEILIGEDCSTDGTRQIVEDYAQKYPNIKLVKSEKNVGPNKNFQRVLKKARGKYIALCDGDDYWINSTKLQKQVDFLENNPKYTICGHYCKEIDQEGKMLYVHKKPVCLQYSYSDLVINKQVETSTASLVIRYSDDFKELLKKDWFPVCNAADKFIKLFATSTGKKIYVMPEIMSCYRRHPGGIWSMTDAEILKQRQLNDFYIIIKNFEHNLIQKIAIFIFYLRRYFLFEFRKTKLRSTLQTIRAIYN